MPMLYKRFMTDCVVERMATSPDGEGGFTTTWEDSDSFSAAFVLDSSNKTTIADKDTTVNTYTVTTDKETSIEFGSIIRRLFDDKRFMVVSNGDDNHTPILASMSFRQFKAVEWAREDV